MAAIGATVPPATYDLIGTWINQQQQAPVPLTDKLRSALIGLENALKAEPVPQSEPELGDVNWVGLLQEYRAAYPFKGSQEVNFAESPFDPTNRGQIRWKCQVTIGEAPNAAFPHADGNQPAFARKKDAKKYAAKCAVEWLRAKGFLPKEGVRFPKGTITAHQQQAQSKSQQLKESSNSHAKAPSPPTSIPSSPFDSSQPSAAGQVSELCRALGIPHPKYDCRPVGGGFFRGYADFGSYTNMLPFDGSKLGPDVMGKKAAKEMVAEYLLEQLEAEKEKRDRDKEAFLAQYSKE
ncbi:hypothetical protein EKO27_g2953 [Xylaria grammica]|uniref:DRBM domain-containing protein n=1 Tax=Xylaria grammica TaxID=363999 RepID=A0A439DCK8_9PEZI|nr:hypothetical protein EKO27_g2953 [Xylaria grammica]